MRNGKKISILLALVVLSSIIYFSCQVDNGIAPLPGKIKVTVFFRGTPPKDTQGIYLTVAPEFPPHAINELFHSPNSLPIDQDTVYTEMELPFGHYDAVCLWWYNTNTKSNLADILALPLDASNNLMPLSFDLTAEDPVYEIELFPNWNRVDRNATIEGTIYFNGPFPENTLATAIAAYYKYPANNIEYLTMLKSMDFSIDSNPYHYKLPVHYGNVNYIAVFWLAERAHLTDFKTLGFYQTPDNPGVPAEIYIKQNETISDIDIYADWSKTNE